MSIVVSEIELRSFCETALIKAGMDMAYARVMSNVLVQTDMWGIHTHGVKNLYEYITKAEAGGVDFKKKPVIEKQIGSIAVINGNNTMGYISSSIAMDLACSMAEKSGAGIVFVKNSSHYGASGYYANMAASKGMIGFAASNVDKKMSVPGAKGMVMGHNPFALAAPAETFPSVILDIATSNVASLRVLKAKQKGEKIPTTWISDKDGIPTDDPSHYPDEGALLPMGAHKGYGIAMFIEILTSIVLGTPDSTRDDVYSWCFDLDKPNNVSHVFMAVNPMLVDSDGGFTKRVQTFISELQNAPKAEGSKRITVPGERMWERYHVAEKNGIELPDDVTEELEKLASKYDISLKQL